MRPVAAATGAGLARGAGRGSPPMPARRALLAAGFVCFAAADAALAQATGATAVSGLQFGVVIAGINTAVPPSDASRRGEAQITGSGNVDIRLVLPASLAAADGSLLPLRFGTGDGATATARAAALATFDPSTTTRVNITAGGGTVRVFIGGTAQPAADQLPGTYSGVVSVIVTRPNQ
jgi:hypothetical protein